MVITDFDKLSGWDREEFGVEKLIELSTKKSMCNPRRSDLWFRWSHLLTIMMHSRYPDP